MGILQSEEQRKALERATQIRQQILNRVKRKYDRLKPDMDRIAPQTKNRIKRASAAQLTTLMDDKKITSLDIALTFIERTATIGMNYLNKLSFKPRNVIVSETRIQAKDVGDMVIITLRPFFGVVVSVKESILMKDRITYIGHVNVVNLVPTQMPVFESLIRRMGFIPFARTTVPPCCKLSQTISNIFSYAKNGWNESRSCGGSSGGEGGMLGSGCSPFGIGSDIGVSIRIPAEWNGLCSIKPSSRYSNLGNAYFGKYTMGAPFKSQICPIARSVQDIRIFCQFLFDPGNYIELDIQKRDIYSRHLPYQMNIIQNKPKLNIGYFYDVKDFYQSSSSHIRVVNHCVDILRNKGHQVKHIQIPGLMKLFLFFLRTLSSDPTIDILNEIRQKQPPIKQYRMYYLLAKIPWIIKAIIAWLIRQRYPRINKIINANRPMASNVEAVTLIYQNIKIRQRCIYQFLVKQQIDVWICPGYPISAIKHGTIETPAFTRSSAIWNSIHYPAGIVPVSVVGADELTFKDDFRDLISKSMEKSIKQSLGLPVGLQVISYPNNQEQILYVMQQIEAQVQFRQFHSSSALNK